MLMSHGNIVHGNITALYVVSGYIKKLFSTDYVSIDLFATFFSIEFARWKSVTPHCLYHDSITLIDNPILL